MMADLPGYVVVHIGAVGTLDNIRDNVNLLGAASRKLLLENSSGAGTQMGKSIEEVRKLMESLDRPVGMCLDTQHCFSSGMSRFDSYESVIRLYEELRAITTVPVVHLNDSKVICGNHRDAHENIFEGCMWRSERDSFDALLDIGADEGTDFILETPNAYRDLEVVRAHINEDAT
jgi:endonuclease IV